MGIANCILQAVARSQAHGQTRVKRIACGGGIYRFYVKRRQAHLSIGAQAICAVFAEGDDDAFCAASAQRFGRSGAPFIERFAFAVDAGEKLGFGLVGGYIVCQRKQFVFNGAGGRGVKHDLCAARARKAHCMVHGVCIHLQLKQCDLRAFKRGAQRIDFLQGNGGVRVRGDDNCIIAILSDQHAVCARSLGAVNDYALGDNSVFPKRIKQKASAFVRADLAEHRRVRAQARAGRRLVSALAAGKESACIACDCFARAGKAVRPDEAIIE